MPLLTNQSHYNTTDMLPNSNEITNSKCEFALQSSAVRFLSICLRGLGVNILAFFVLRRMGSLCTGVDHTIVSILNINDIMCLGSVVLNMFIAWSSCGEIAKHPMFCRFFGFLNTVLVIWSAYILTISPTCRYLSIVKPFWYRRWVTKKKVAMACFFSLIPSLIVNTFPLTGLANPYYYKDEISLCMANFMPGKSTCGQRMYVCTTSILVVVTSLWVTYCNCYIIYRLRKRTMVDNDVTQIAATTTVAKATIATANTTSGATAEGALPSSSNSVCPVTSQGQRRRKKNNLFQTVSMIVTMVYVFCYMPRAMQCVIDAVNDNYEFTMKQSGLFSMVLLSAIINPLIYAIFNSSFRSTLLALLRCKKTIH